VKAGSQIPADPSSGYTAPFNKVVIVVKASDLGLNPGDTISGFVSGVSQTAGGAITGLYDQMPDSLAFTGSYTVNSNQFCRPNAAPTAVLTATPTSGTAPLTVNFDGSGSYDPDTAPPPDTIASYTFNFGDGSAAVTQSTPTISHTYNTAGNYAARLTVTDSRGAVSTNTAQVVISVTTKPPDLIVAALTASKNPAHPGDNVTFTAKITNSGQQNAGASRTEFLLDGATALGLINTPALAPGTSATVSATWNTAKAKKGQHTIKATADKTNAVAESNEANNTMTITVSLK
jgi:PKD repeat protein